MSKQIKLFVGLGNPGHKYKNTRHNLGFMVLDSIALAKGLEFKNWDNVADISFYEGSSIGRVWLLKPTTFMNLSGDAVSSFAKYYKISTEEIVICYDDFSIPLGGYKIRMSGSAGGHNGIKSIIERLHTDKFPRIKFGIGPLPKFMDMSDFVLSKFAKEDENKINLVKKISVEIFDEINASNIDKAASKLADKNRTLE
ncbi:aminoacyl-tRNA hydrolase [Candidatus Endomicrobiellum devescovinae]|uniref:aminoacyl-tRNA hydrolase n=1 Tax=Candidatus Endomicrobiellum devescovinae TaxID=3242322 RepID=UPI0028316EF6|nr:aminoacyl-tRNA hydrolase [Endomicrobium sp.]